MTRAAARWCSVCQSNFRGTYGAHASTDKHRGNIRRRENPAGGNRSDLNRTLGVARIRSAREVYTGQDLTKVRKYRRRRPLDGPRRSVHVRRYWRHLFHPVVWIPASASEIKRRLGMGR